MKRVTVEDVMKWEPCLDYPRERVEELFAGRESLGWREILETGLPSKDLLWVFLHPEFLSERRMHLLACDFAEAVLHLTDDPRPAAALRVKRLWVDGQATDEELETARKASRAAAWDARAAAGEAAWDASWAATWDAAWAATWAAARGAALDSARAVAWAAARTAARAAGEAAWDASWDSQLALVIAALEEERD